MGVIDLAIILLGGLAGATVFGFVRPDREDSTRAVFSTLLGTIISGAVTPMACLYWGMQDVEYKGGVAFGIGLIGMTICRIIVVSMQTEANGIGPWFVKMVKKLFGVQT